MPEVIFSRKIARVLTVIFCLWCLPTYIIQFLNPLSLLPPSEPAVGLLAPGGGGETQDENQTALKAHFSL